MSALTELVRSWLGGLRDAATTRTVWVGFVGSFCILVGSLSPAYLPQASPVWDVLYALRLDGDVVRWAGTILTLFGLFLLVEAWLRLRPTRREARGRRQLRHWAVLVIMAFPLVIGPPTFSHDAYSYAAQGWMLHNGINPYEVGPGVLPGQFADQVSWEWRDTPAPYGPLALRISHLLVLIGGFDPIWSTLLQRVPALIGVALIGWCVPRIARWMRVSPSAASWFAVLNPILIIDFIGGMHNDSLMVGLMVLGIWLAMRLSGPSELERRGRAILPWLPGAVLVGMAAAIKQPAILAAVSLPFIAQTWASWRPGPTLWAALRCVVSLGVAAATFAAISLWSGLDFGWVNAVHVPATVDTVSPTTIVGYMIQIPINQLGIDPTGRAAIMAMRAVGWGLFGIGVVVLAIRLLGRKPLHFTSWSFIWFGLCAPALHSWYMLWGGVLFPMTRPAQKWLRAAIVITVVLLGYAAMNFSLRNGPWMLAVLMIAAIYWSVHSHELQQRWTDADELRPASDSPLA